MLDIVGIIFSPDHDGLDGSQLLVLYAENMFEELISEIVL